MGYRIVNPQLGSGLGLGLDSVRGSTISHKMKYLPDHNHKALTNYFDIVDSAHRNNKLTKIMRLKCQNTFE